jgi:hypothetical protein
VTEMDPAAIVYINAMEKIIQNIKYREFNKLENQIRNLNYLLCVKQETLKRYVILSF